jgi:hypothetical protein
MIKKWVSIFCFIFMMVTTVVWAKPDSTYIDNGNGTVTDIETKLMWQQATADKMNWYVAKPYCKDLRLAGYTDWRLPTLDELKTLVDQSWGNNPTINRTFFPGTVSAFYWASSTSAYYMNDSWGLSFYNGVIYKYNPLSSLYVRAVRGGQSGSLDNLVISPLSRTVTMDAGSITFGVSNTGTGIIPWKAAVTVGTDWLSISSGAGGTDTGTITCAYTANTSTSSRTGKIWVTAYGDGTSTQKDVTVTQSTIYVDNGNGTVTDIETKLIWQQATAPNTYNRDQAISYCESLSFAGYTDWRLPTLDELKTLVDSTQTPPKINHTFFPDTRLDAYWSSTTDASNTSFAWGVDFFYGGGYMYSKPSSYYVRAVRGGQPNLVISPLSQMVTKDTGSTSFSVSNTGTGTMPWTAAVTSDSSWLTITSGASGTNTGVITCDYTANTSTSSRTGTIRVTATGAKGSPTDVTVTQAPPTPTACTATTYGNLLLHIPYLSYIDPASETLSFWADLVNEVNPTYPMLILFKLTILKIIENPSFSCEASTLSNDFKIHIPDVLSPDGGTHLWVDMEYSQALSTDENVYFEVTKLGVVSN